MSIPLIIPSEDAGPSRSPPISPSPPITMIPRSKPSRRNSQHRSAPPSKPGTPPAMPVLPGQAGSSSDKTAGSTTTSAPLTENIVTPSTPPELDQPPQPSGSKLPSTTSRGGGDSGQLASPSSSHDDSTEGGIHVAIPRRPSVSLARLDAIQTEPVAPVMQKITGASMMAAAARRGQAGLDGTPMMKSHSDEEDHPLSDKSLRARDYQTHLNRGYLFHLPTRWKLVRSLGQGAYGLVIAVQDIHTGSDVAVKMVNKVFDRFILAKRALREIALLRHFEKFGGHENLTGLIDLDHVWEGYNEIYFYMEPMEADLHQIIRSNQTLSKQHVQFFTYQILRGMKFVHSANVIHRDLKPGNILVNADCEVKICDFGLARGFIPVKGEEDQNAELHMTQWVATRWYRAPEVMLSYKRYTTAIDVWSIGCILAELLTRRPLFKGDDYGTQLTLIMEVLGTPSDEVLNKLASEKAMQYMRTLPKFEPVPLQLVVPEGDGLCLDLLSQLIEFDPHARTTVAEAIQHPWLAQWHIAADEPDCPEVFSQWEEVESLQTTAEVRAAISKEIAEHREMVRNPAALDEEEDEDEELEILIQDVEIEDLIPVTELLTSPDAIPATTPSVPFPRNSIASGMNGDDRPHPDLVAALSDRQAAAISRDRRESTPSSIGDASFETSPSMGVSASMAGNKSRRTSASSNVGRRAASFFRLTSGFTPVAQSFPPSTVANTVSSSNGSSAAVSPETSRSPSRRLSSIGGHNPLAGPETFTTTTAGRMPKSRTVSQASEFGGMRPIVRQLSVVGLENLQSGKERGQYPAKTGEEQEADEVEVEARDGMDGVEGVETRGRRRVKEQGHPMAVSPSDAPPSTMGDF